MPRVQAGFSWGMQIVATLWMNGARKARTGKEIR